MSNQDTANHDALDVARRSLAEAIFRMTDKEQLLETEIPGFMLVRFTEPTEPKSGIYEPSICYVVQGAKRAVLEGEEYVYGPDNYLVTSVELPVEMSVAEASEETPLLGLVLKVDLHTVSRMMVENSLSASGSKRTGRGMILGQVSPPLLNSFQRLIELLDQPEDIPVLAPLILKEVMYRVLTGEQGPRLRQIASIGSHGHQIARAIDWLKGNYARQFKIEKLASDVGMSISTFHQHFRAVTAMSPLQYQKKMRLLEARRLMLMERQDAASAAIQVGYESPSHFSREYKRQFGAPPLRDIRNLQEAEA